MTFILNAEKSSKDFKLEKWCGEKRVIRSDLPFEKSTVPKVWRTHGWEGRTKADELRGYCSKQCKSKFIVKLFGHFFLPGSLGKILYFPEKTCPL